MKIELDIALVKSYYKPRLADSHKGNHGHALLVAGRKGMMGAAIISSRACVRSGIGLLTTLLPESERTILQQSVPEAMLAFELPGKKKIHQYSAVAIGPGMGTEKNAKEQLEKIISAAPQKLLLDADALNILATNKKLLALLPKQTILTPHIKEFDRIFGEHKTNEQRIRTAKAAAKKWKIIIVLKNATTIITDGKHGVYNNRQNAGLAKGGSGDMLTGIMLAFLAQGYKPLEAAMMAVYIHSTAAAKCLTTQSEESMLATDVVEYIGAAFETLKN